MQSQRAEGQPGAVALKLVRYLAAASLAIGLVGCGSFPHRATPVGIDGVACVGRLKDPPRHALQTTDQTLLDEARGVSGKGGLCEGKVFVAEETIRVYRVWDSSRESSTFGRWWSLTRPEGTREAYRLEYAICQSWSALDRLISCTLKLKELMVIGTTQSAECDEGTIPKSPAIQVYLRNQPPEQLLVENCRDEGSWP